VDQADGGYIRRIAAVLVADVSGFSALMGEDDERTARDVRSVQTLVQAIVSELQGHAEPLAGDSIFASFESVVAAVEAALRIQRRLAEAGTPHLRLRIGVHFGDVLVSPEGAALGVAINVAARLCALARPGTVCVSEGVCRHVRGRFDEPFEDLGRQRLKNISDPVRAFLIVPQGAAAAGGSRSPLAVWGATALGVAALALLAMWWWPVPPSSVPPPGPAAAASPVTSAAPEGVRIGVMLFKPLRDDPEHAWMREALRDGLNTQLSGLTKVKVYSKEFLDLLIQREGLSELEAAKKLGISKMVSGSFVAMGNTLSIETHVVDVQSGVLETSAATAGPVAQFLSLQTKMTEGVIARLDIPITAEERRTLLAQQNTNVEALKMLLEAEGSPAAEPAPGPPPPERGSLLLRWIARSIAAGDAWADDRADIVAVVEQYRKATEARDVAAVSAVYADFTSDQQVAQQRYFANATDLKVAFADVEVVVLGDDAVASYTRVDDFTDARTGHPMHVQLRLTKKLTRTAAGWKLAAAK
jgi:class 3 adenylate cyclase/TolB-like protein/ketosteroid isomerase-like protein